MCLIGFLYWSERNDGDDSGVYNIFFVFFSRMGFSYFLCLLLGAAALTVSKVLGQDNPEVYWWSKQSLPVLVDTRTEPFNTPLFRGQEEDEGRAGTKASCGIECQSSSPSIDQKEQERILGYETMYENGTRTHTDVSLLYFNRINEETPANSSARTRRKRQVYGEDGRFVISDSHYITNYPFSTAVRVSTGCSGILISPKHVLTAAHCIHDGRDYLESARKVKVGVLQLKSQRRRGSRRRGGKQKGEEQTMEKGQEQNVVDGDAIVGSKGGKVNRRRSQKEVEGVAGHGGKYKRRRRTRRSAERKRQPAFRWASVNQIRIPQGWIQTKGSTKSLSTEYDYAVIDLKRPLKQKYMELGVAPSATPLTRIHFSGYDTDKSPHDKSGEEKVIYRFCTVANESDNLLYQHCDAQPGATGAGVYIRLRQEVGDADRKGKWQRRVIGVFAGHQWVGAEGGGERDYNVAVRITPLKYAQICHWIHGDPSHCKEV